MSRTFAFRLIENLFRRWRLLLLPVLLLSLLGVVSASRLQSKYSASSVMYVESETLLTKLTGAGAGSGNNYLTPAQAANDRLRSLLGTDGFVKAVADKAKLTDALAAGVWTLDGVRNAIGTFPSSSNTLRIDVETAEPTTAYNVAAATVETFIDWVIDASLSDSATAEKFLQSLATSYQNDVIAAERSLTSYFDAHPDPAVGARPQSEALEIQKLNEEVIAAKRRYSDTLGKAENARLVSAQTRSDVAGRLRVVDAPVLPTAPNASLVAKVTQLGLFVFLGLLLTTAGLFLLTLMDRSVRFADEIPRTFGVPLLAVVPQSRTSSGRLVKGANHV